jgi:hypothetical protein
MPLRRTASLVPLLLALAAGGASASTASADEPVGASAQGTPIVADAGYAAWRGDDGRIVIRAGDGAPRVTNLRPPASSIFDVGVGPGGDGAQLVYTEGCSTRSHACTVRSAALRSSGTLSTRVVAHISYRGGGSPAIAAYGSRLIYAVHGTTGRGRTASACDVPYVRTGTGTPRRLDRGHCSAISQLDGGDGYVALLAHPGIRSGSGATEARVIKVTGGPSRTLQREAQGEESNYIGAVAIDREALYTARGGIRQANVFARIQLGSRARSDARAFVSLEGAFARDRGRNFYAQAVGFEASTECPCVLVAGRDPFASGTRQLVPELGLTVTPQPVFTDSAPSAVATLSRRTVSRTAVVGGPAPVAGVPVELLSATAASTETAPPVPAPTGATATTGADGTATIAIPGTPVPRRFLTAVTRPAAGGVAIPSANNVYLQTYVRMTAAAERLADGRLRVTGTISPAQAGRKVRLDRKLDRICNQGTTIPGTVVQPQQAGVPAGCFDRYTQDPVTTASVSADGTSYTLEAPAGSAPAGTYSVSLDSPRGASVYAGQTTGFTAP